jgi:uncharacterized protein DUF5681
MSNKTEGPVGYGRPPVATRFKAGRSGNPSGRPKRVNGLKAELLDELGEVLRIREGDSELEVSKARAIAKSLVRAAVGGNMRATTALLAFFAKTPSDADESTADVAAAEDAEILDDYIGRELRRRAGNSSATDNPQSETNEDKEYDK